MILVDSSVWIDHLRQADPVLSAMLNRAQVLSHPFVIGELALGRFRQRAQILGGLQSLPKATVGDDGEVLGFIDRHQLHGRGIGYVDVHLLTSVRLTVDAALWTRDKRLHAAAVDLDIAAAFP